jgi:hypothetical protein
MVDIMHRCDEATGSDEHWRLNTAKMILKFFLP